MSFTPRRSTRGAIFTPSPHPSTSALREPDTTYTWLSSSSTRPDSPHPHYNSFSRVVTHPLDSRRGKGKGKSKDGVDESRFAVGDGVMVAVEGGSEGVGVLIRLWEEPPESDETEDGEDEDDDGDESSRGDEDNGPRMMGEVHWCFRRQDLPGIMKNLSVEDVSGLGANTQLRASPAAE